MLSPLDVIGGWTLRERIGRGGMGEVWRAERDGETGALKVIFARPDRREAARRRFAREVEAASRIGHPGVVRLLDWGAPDDGPLFLVMELLDGASLRDRMPTMTPGERVAAVRALLEPLAAAHALEPPIVHRDLKPENVFVTVSGEVKLLDFGIARRSGAGTDVTDTGAGLGTAAYMSPEQATEARDVGPAADVWSVGVMLYEALAGRPPFDAPSKNEIITKILTRDPVPLSEAAPDVAPALARLVGRCLAKEPERRPVDARALAGAMDGAPASAPPRASGWMIAAAVLAAAAGAWALYPASAPPRRVAITKAARPDPPPTSEPARAPADVNEFIEIEAAPDLVLGVPDARPEEQSGFRPAADQRGPTARFEIQRHEVTWGELAPWLEANGRPVPEGSDAAMPATGVDWSDARAFCRTLDADLPTEAQWERAARGARGALGAPEGVGAGAPIGRVGARTADRTTEGVWDLAGNAREWTRELFRADATGEVEAWVTADGRSHRAVRGLPVEVRSRWMPPPGAELAHRVPLCATGDCPPATERVQREVGFRCAR